MKNKKWLFPGLVAVVAVLAIAACAVCTFIAYKPAVTEQSFDFSITYTLQGKTVTIDDVYTVRYTGNDGYADTLSRTYEGEVASIGEEDTAEYTLWEEEGEYIILDTRLYPGYMMGDPEHNYFEDEPFEPRILYYDAEGNEYSDEETLLAHGVQLDSWEYPAPITNTFVYSHISYFNGELVVPTVLIAVAALAIILIFVRKDEEVLYKDVDKVSTILDFIVGLAFVPFISIVVMFVDIVGGSADLFRQVLYFIPTLSMLCVAASVVLRRKGYSKSALYTALVGPAVFAVYYAVSIVIEGF